MLVTEKKRKAPAVTIRFRSKAELATIKRAAKLEGRSLNTFVAMRVSQAANEVVASATKYQSSEIA